MGGAMLRIAEDNGLPHQCEHWFAMTPLSVFCFVVNGAKMLRIGVFPV